MLTKRIYRFAGNSMDQFESWLPLEQPRARPPQKRNIDAVVIRIAMIEHNYRAPAGTQHSMNFPNRFGGVRRVMQNPMGINQIETLVGEVEIFRIGGLKLS